MIHTVINWLLGSSFADLHHIDADQDADLDHAFHFDAYLDPAFHFDADLDPAFHSDVDPDLHPRYL